ncbi:uncharacterized protein LOC106051704 isoform X1 [Biomphalaria glabrata]|uniref:Uncharacterized protein LOC106051704 isoform X1 n=1 Tax=Biomphalaria glabrata TaxID=6526 RepID=A0A9W2YUT3_BIOGL|nr:uncharacterized protein LOC106051704 isoform X1 [Biomphalaria glabrata]XP_055866482.1 uncharacterized protein LOC106051704 isoform X1 [Biomphalaria glabrata]XP_055866483.1 uncharacterized protein LOC106051704 isoform X1 [Biomphalaria glabrata]
MSQFYFLILTLTIICALNLTGTRSQSVKFYDNGEDTDECMETLRAGTDGMVLRGVAHLPKQPNWTSYIIFDQKSEAAGDFKLLCLVDTKSQCENTSVSDICYCQPTETVDTYQFVVNLSAVTTEYSGLIRAYLMMKNSTTVSNQISLSSWRESNSPVKTSLTINDEPIGDNCMATIHNKKLKIEASCAGMRGPCWLELSTGHNTMPAVGDKHITLEHSVEADTNVTVVLRRSLCNKENFHEMYRCQITLVTSLEVQEASSNILLISVVAGIASAVVLVLVTVVIVFWRRKHVQKKKLRTESNERVRDLCEEESKTFTKKSNLPTVPNMEKSDDDTTELLTPDARSTQGNNKVETEDQSPTETSLHFVYPKKTGKRSPNLRKDPEVMKEKADYMTSLLTPPDAFESPEDHNTREIEEQKCIDAGSSTPIEAKSSLQVTGCEGAQKQYAAEEQTPTESYSDTYYNNAENDPVNFSKPPKELKEKFQPVVKDIESFSAFTLKKGNQNKTRDMEV